MRTICMIKLSIIIISVLFLTVHVRGQKGQVEKDRSDLTGISFPGKAIEDTRLLSVAAAKSILEMESGIYQIMIKQVEVFSIPNPSNIKDGAKKYADDLVESIKQYGYDVWPSLENPAYTWLRGNNRIILMYLSTTKKETALYIGIADNLPAFTNKSKIADTGSVMALNEITKKECMYVKYDENQSRWEELCRE